MSKQRKKKQNKKMARRLVTFESKADRTLWKLARAGASNSLIARETRGQTRGQIHYRLKVLKDRFGFKESVRNRWKNGHDPLFWQFIEEHDAVIMADLDSQVVPQLVHPTPVVVEAQ